VNPNPKLLVNSEKETILESIKEELELCDKFYFSVAFITTNAIALLIDLLLKLERRGVKGIVLTSNYLNFTQPLALKRIQKFKNIKLKIATKNNFHSKGYLFKRGDSYNLIVGSSNLTANALLKNSELNLKISAQKDSEIIDSFFNYFKKEFNLASEVDERFLIDYERIYLKNRVFQKSIESKIEKISANSMQIEALANIQKLRERGKKKALLISATGTGKTYLSAFDVKRFKLKKFLFVVHRLRIAKEALKTFKTLLPKSFSMGLFSGEFQEREKDYLFATIQTLSKKNHLESFKRDEFDYIVIDESHRSVANSYKRVIEYFEPKFMLGMSATPERLDGLDIFSIFNHNIAYEIRLHQALEQDMLSPFHYFGISDLTIDGVEIDDKSKFNSLVDESRIKHIIEKLDFYGCDSETIRGLIFCSRVDEARVLSSEFNKRGFKTIALSGDSLESERNEAIERLESDDLGQKLDYIFSVDIFNEGVDIPRVNQIVMLRATASPTIFIQQLGRGVRKHRDKEYLTVIDFIGNYENNYLIPIALFGDNSYSKENLKRALASKKALISGCSSVHFDEITKRRIFKSIDLANMQLKRDLIKDYKLLKFKLGSIPLMMDFVKNSFREPKLYIDYSKSYFNFVADVESEFKERLDKRAKKLLELFSSEINSGKRIEESFILRELIEKNELNIEKFRESIHQKYSYKISEEILKSVINSLNFGFITEKSDKKLKSVKEIYGFEIVKELDKSLTIGRDLKEALESKTFREFLIDSVDYSFYSFEKRFREDEFIDGFVLYGKYSRKDVFRILKWQRNPLASLGGYVVSKDGKNCPIFINYNKKESATEYDNSFIDRFEFNWFSKARRDLNSPDIKAIRAENIRIPIFIRKSSSELEFYYMGDAEPREFKEVISVDKNGKKVTSVKVIFRLKREINENIYHYLTQV